MNQHLLFSACALLALLSLPANAQREWTLDQCVAYALDHNASVQQMSLQVEDAQLQLHTSRHSRLPDLNASLGQSFSFGRSQGREGVTEDLSSTNTSFGISTSVPLFTGFRIPNQIRADRENLRAAEEKLEARRRELSITITGYFLNALYYKGVMGVAAEQVTLDSLLLQTARALVDEGRKAESEVYEAEAALASSRLNLTTAQGNYRRTLLDLTHSINYEESASIPVPAPVSELENESLAARYIDNTAWIAVGVTSHPSVLAAEHQLRGSEYSWRVARSAYYPSLNFGAGYSNSYYYKFNSVNESFGNQLRLNGSEYLSLSLNIPIFNRLSTRNSVRRAKLNITNNRLQLEETRRMLRKEIEQAQIDAVNARERLASALQAERTNQLACHYEREKYAAGKSTLYVLSQAQQKLIAARNDVVQARCELALRLRILKYYD